MSNTLSKDALKVMALKERIASIVANYEEQMADFRADSTIMINTLNERVANLEEELNSIRGGDGPENPEHVDEEEK